jgi:hypothetical protein
MCFSHSNEIFDVKNIDDLIFLESIPFLTFKRSQIKGRIVITICWKDSKRETKFD